MPKVTPMTAATSEYASEPDPLSVIPLWAVKESGVAEFPITLSAAGQEIDITIREAKALRAGLARAIKEHS